MAKMWFNDIDLAGASYGVLVHDAAVALSPARAVDYQAVPYSAGGVAQGQFSQERVIQVTASISAETESAFRDRVDNVNAALTVDQPKPLRFDYYYPDRQWQAMPRGPVPAEYRQGRFARFELAFLCPRGTAESLTERTTPNITITTTPQDFDLEGAAAVGGNTDAEPVYTITNTAGGSVTPPIRIRNLTTGVTGTWNGLLEAGHLLRIDTRRKLVERSTDAGATWSVSMGPWASGHAFPTLRAGVVNEMRVEGPDDATLAIVYRERFL